MRTQQRSIFEIVARPKPKLFASGSSRPAHMTGFVRARHPVGVVAGELSPRARQLLVGAAAAGLDVFVDSGAFNAFRAGQTLDFDEVLAVYDELAAGVPAQRRMHLHLVAPDSIGSQSETLRLQRLPKYARRLRGYLEAGVTLLVPIQVGELAPGQVHRKLVRLLKTRRFVASVPSNAAAFELEDLESLLCERPWAIHLLGVGVNERVLKPRLDLVARLSPMTRVTIDACRLRAWVGRGRRVTEAVKERLPEQLALAGRGEGEFGEFDETEWAGYFDGLVTEADLKRVAEHLRHLGMDRKQVRQMARAGELGNFLLDLGRWGWHILTSVVAWRATRAIRPGLTTEAIAEQARKELAA